MRKLIPILIVVASLACYRSEAPLMEESHESAASPVGAASTVGVEKQQAVADASSVAAATSQTASAVPRMIVRTASMRIIVADTSKTVDAVTKSVEAAGGYVSGSEIWREGELLRAKLTLRVPADQLTSTLAAIRGVAKRVDNETIASADAAQEYVDLQSQVRNLEATEAELRELLKTARVNSSEAEEVLKVHQQLTMVRGQIEQAKGRMLYLSQLTAMSMVALDVVPDAIAQPVVKPGWQPVVVIKDASRALVSLLQGLATAAIWFVIYLLPVLGMLAVAIFVFVRIARRMRTREA